MAAHHGGVDFLRVRSRARLRGAIAGVGGRLAGTPVPSHARLAPTGSTTPAADDGGVMSDTEPVGAPKRIEDARGCRAPASLAPRVPRTGRVRPARAARAFRRLRAQGGRRRMARLFAIDFLKDKAVFCVFRRSNEFPLYRIEKNPKLARRQGAYAVIAASGLLMKRGHELARALGARQAAEAGGGLTPRAVGAAAPGAFLIRPSAGPRAPSRGDPAGLRSRRTRWPLRSPRRRR